MVARSVSLGLPLPPPDTIVFPAIDGVSREAVSAPTFYGEYDHRHLMRSLLVNSSSRMLLSSPQELSGRLFEDVVGQIKKDMICIEAHRLSEQSLLLLAEIVIRGVLEDVKECILPRATWDWAREGLI